MAWAEIRIHTTNEALEPITNILYEKGASGVVIEDPKDLDKPRGNDFGEIYELDKYKYPLDGIFIKVYFPNNDMLNHKILKITKLINQLNKYDIDIGKNKLEITYIKEEDWSTSWQKYYKPVKVSDTITIVPSWHEYHTRSEQDKIVYLDPGMAFGTGTHPTTKLSIRALEKYIKNTQDIIDVGCGSGVLSIVSCLLGAKKVFSFDLDYVAVKSTQHNLILNDLKDQISVKQNDLLKGIHLNADMIVANILAEIIIDLIDDAWSNLKSGGLFIASGIIGKKKKMVLEGLEKKGFKTVEIKQMDDWVCIISKKIK